MSNDAKKPVNGSGGAAAAAAAAGGGFRAKLEHVLYSGEKKHVAAGMAIIGVLFGVPWYLMTRGSKQQSHQDYMEKADKARSERLSAGSSKTR